MGNSRNTGYLQNIVQYDANNNIILPSLTGTGTRMVVAGSTGLLSTQAIPSLSDLSGVPTSRTLTINGVTYDLTANRTWSALPTGGAAGDILAKVDGTDYNATWIPNYTSQVQHQVKLGATMTAGTPVYVSGSTGNAGTNMIVSKASNAAEGTSSKTLGLIATGGVTNDIVFVVTEGLLAGLDTSTATAGDPVWLGTNGGLIFGLLNKPTAPAHLVFIGVVTRAQQNNGEIFVKVQNGFELDELHNLSVASPSDGDMIKYVASTGLWTKIAASTTNIVEGTNLYYTQGRFDTAFAAKSTTNLTEGTNLYYTDARVGTYLTNNSYVTQTYVNTAVSNLVDAAPGTLDTLNELAAALGDDPNFATTVATSIGTKEPAITAGTTSQYWRGDKTWQTLPVYTLSGLGGVPTTRSLTINGTAYDLSADRSWTINSMVYPGAGIPVSTGTAWGTSITNNSANWNTAYGWGNHASAGYLTSITSSQVTTALGYTPYNATNPNGYISSYTETDTLASVTSRGSSTSTTLNLDGRVNIGNGLTRPGALNSDSAAHARIGGSDVHLYIASLGAGGGYKVAVQAARTSDFQSFDLDLQSNGGTLRYGGNEIATRSWVTSQNYLTSITSSQVTTALGFTPYNSTNPSGYLTSLYGWTNTPDSWYGIGQSTSAGGATAVGGYYPWALSYHTGLALSAHSAYGGIRFYNQNYPTAPMHTTPVMQIVNGSVLINGNTAWHQGNLTNLNQLSNGPGYITGYTETDTFGTVVGRGTTASSGGSYGLSLTHTYNQTSLFHNALFLKANNSGAELGASIGFAVVTAGGDHHRAVIRATGTAGNTGGQFAIYTRRGSDAENIRGYYQDDTGNVRFDNYVGIGQDPNTGYRLITNGSIYLNSNGNGWAEGVFKQRRSGSTFYDVIDAGNIGSQSVSYATSAGSTSQFAGKGLGDFEGNFATTINASGLDANTYYPVTIGVPTNRLVKLSIRVALNSNTPSWATHPSGFSVKLIWYTNGNGWGTNDTVRYIESYNYRFVSGKSPIGGLQQLSNSSEEVVWVRGGGIYYCFGSEQLTWTLRTSSYNNYDPPYTQNVTPTTADSINDVWSTSNGRVSYGEVYSSGSIIAGYRLQTPDFTLGYWDGTNNRIEAGSGRPLLITSYGSAVKIGLSGDTHMTVTGSGVYAAKYFVNGDSWIVFNNEEGSWGVKTRTTTSTANLGSALKNLIYNGGGSNEGFAFTGNGTGAPSMEVRNDGVVWVKTDINVPNHYVGNYFRLNTSRAASEHGYAGLFKNTQYASSNYVPFSFESEYGTHSWGVVARFRINQSGADRPSIQFSTATNDTRWNVGYCYSQDDNFRITQNMGYRNDGNYDGWGTERFRINTDGATYCFSSFTASGDVTAYSDIRIKSDIQTVTDPIEKIKAIRGVTFKRNDTDDKDRKHLGVVAQEVMDVLPEVISETDKGLFTVAYGNMAGLFIEAIKEQQAQIESQKTEIEELKDLVKQLINR